MCGIVGAFALNSNLSEKDKTIFIQMLHADVLRGPHSFGVIRVSDKKDVAFRKTAWSHPLAAMDYDKEWQKWMEKPTKVLVGHNRWATHGKVNSENAHPFQHGPLTQVHNGTLHENYKGHEVDSDWLCKKLSLLPNNEERAKFLSEVDGSFALVWWDDETKTVNMVRNTSRPLFRVKWAGCVFFASEAKMLDWIISRNGGGGYTIEIVPEGKIYSYDLSYSDPKVTELPKKVAVQSKYTDWRRRDDTPQTQKTETAESVRRALTAKETQTAIVEIMDWYPIYGMKVCGLDGQQQQAFAVHAQIRHFVEKYNTDLMYKIDDNVLVLSISEDRLDNVFNDENSMGYAVVDLNGRDSEIHATVLPGQKSSTAFWSDPSKRENNAYPNVDKNTLGTVHLIKGHLGRQATMRVCDAGDWMLVLEPKDIHDAIKKIGSAEPKSNVVSLHGKQECLQLGQDKKHEEEILAIVCGRCRTVIPRGAGVLVIGTECVCINCHQKAKDPVKTTILQGDGDE